VAADQNKKSKNSRFFKMNRELFVFLVFLLFAIAFWLIQTFKDTTSVSVDYQLKINGIPNSVIVTSKIPSDVKVRLHGKGFELLRLMLSSKEKVVEIDYASLKNSSKALVVDGEVWKRAFDKVLPAGISINERSLQTIEIFYSNGDHKNVPVAFKGKVTTEKDYMVGDIIIQPEFVDVYAPKESFDTITVINTSKPQLQNLKDTTTITLDLEPPVGVKCVPDQVKAVVCVDLQTTKRITVPIYTINSPQNIVLKPFPMTATISYQVNASKYNEIHDEEFNAVIDYASIKENDSRCKVNLTAVPEGVTNVKFSPQYVEYVIEQSNDNGE